MRTWLTVTFVTCAIGACASSDPAYPGDDRSLDKADSSFETSIPPTHGSGTARLAVAPTFGAFGFDPHTPDSDNGFSGAMESIPVI